MGLSYQRKRGSWLGNCKRIPVVCILGWILCFLNLQAEKTAAWQSEILTMLCVKYLASTPDPALREKEKAMWIERLSRKMGGLLAASGAAGVPAEDIALLALLQSGHQELFEHRDLESQSPEDASTGIAVGKKTEQQESASVKSREEQGQERTITRGEEGLRQALEEFGRLPVSERLVITGDVTSGAQAATVPAAPDLTSIFGRSRVNLVLRAVPPQGESWEEGIFFMQMMAAGGPPDSSIVGGASSFSAFNDVATDRSVFNDPNLRGNLFLQKAFYEQGIRFGEDRLVARAGVLDMSDYFDSNAFANNEVRSFINSAFVNSPAYKAGIIAPAIVAEYQRAIEGNWLRGVVFRLGSAFSRTDRAFRSPVWTGEIELQTRWRGQRGNWRFGGSIGNVADAGNIRGFYLNMDHWVARDVGIFGRYAISNSGEGSLVLGPVQQSYSVGAQWRFADSQDRESAWAVGFSQAFGIETQDALSSEKILETYYRWQMTNNFSLTPDFQLVFGSGGRRSNGTQSVFGMRMHFGF